MCLRHAGPHPAPGHSQRRADAALAAAMLRAHQAIAEADVAAAGVPLALLGRGDGEAGAGPEGAASARTARLGPRLLVLWAEALQQLVSRGVPLQRALALSCGQVRPLARSCACVAFVGREVGDRGRPPAQ